MTNSGGFKILNKKELKWDTKDLLNTEKDRDITRFLRNVSEDRELSRSLYGETFPASTIS